MGLGKKNGVSHSLHSFPRLSKSRIRLRGNCLISRGPKLPSQARMLPIELPRHLQVSENLGLLIVLLSRWGAERSLSPYTGLTYTSPLATPSSPLATPSSPLSSVEKNKQVGSMSRRNLYFFLGSFIPNFTVMVMKTWTSKWWEVWPKGKATKTKTSVWIFSIV